MFVPKRRGWSLAFYADHICPHITAPDEGLTHPKLNRVARRSHGGGITGSQEGPSPFGYEHG